MQASKDPRVTMSGTRVSVGTGEESRKIAIAVDLSEESAYAVRWAVANYIRPGDHVTILHVRPTSVLYGADWGASDHILEADKESQQKAEEDFDTFTAAKSTELAKPLLELNIPHKIHIVKDHDMKERICLEIERLGVSAVVMGSREDKDGNKTPPHRSHSNLSPSPHQFPSPKKEDIDHKPTTEN
ncbi:hypothetical protein CY35_15G023800 [Sphagnum magellanicum]|nr:hypothetical protein CY35_15G023800 [Sphagnum magellanicum]